MPDKASFFLAPMSTAKDLFDNPHLRARGFWVAMAHPELGTSITYPGPFLRSTEKPPTIRRRAPFIGEHNEEIYIGELGLSKETFAMLKGAGVV